MSEMRKMALRRELERLTENLCFPIGGKLSHSFLCDEYRLVGID